MPQVDTKKNESSFGASVISSAQGTGTAILLACALAIVQLLHTPSLILGDPDEGVYVYAGRLIAEGLVPYRDFMLAHPPLLPLFVASVWKFAPSLIAVRAAYLLVVSVLGLASFALVRRICSSAQAGLVAMALQTLGMLCVANMGRTARLEPMMVLLVVAGAWSLLRSPRRIWLMLAGIFFALALLVKFTAVAVAAPLVLAFLWFDRPDWRSRLSTLAWIVLGGLVIMGPALAWLFSQPGFIRWALQGQLLRPRVGLGPRFFELTKDCLRFPFLALGFLAAVRILLRVRDAVPGERALALTALAGTVILAFGFKSFYAYYFVAVLPLVTACFTIELARFVARHAMARRAWAPAVICSVAIVACLLYVEAYYRLAKNHGEYPARVVALLQPVQGTVYTMIPDFVLWNHQGLPEWYYKVDSYLPRVGGVLGDADFATMLKGVNAAVLSPGEFKEYPQTTAYLDRDFRRAYADDQTELWIRGAAPP